MTRFPRTRTALLRLRLAWLEFRVQCSYIRMAREEREWEQRLKARSAFLRQHEDDDL